MSQKRSRLDTNVSDEADNDQSADAPNKAARAASQKTQSPFVCQLPPTCSHRPTRLGSRPEMERHYAKYHAHVCNAEKCGCVFHEARLLELHQTECHDPIAALRKDRGEKIFACFQPSCDRIFMTPKARRLHLIDTHGYRKDFFFAVTNKGIGGLLAQWGDGASLLRGEWKDRRHEVLDEDEEEEKQKARSRKQEQHEGAMDVDTATQNLQPESNGHKHEEHLEWDDHPAVVNENDGGDDVDALAETMGALNLVPSSVRFGRGGKRSFGGVGGGGKYVKGVADVHHDETTYGRGRGGSRGTGARGSVRGVPAQFLPQRGRGGAFVRGARGVSAATYGRGFAQGTRGRGMAV